METHNERAFTCIVFVCVCVVSVHTLQLHIYTTTAKGKKGILFYLYSKLPTFFCLIFTFVVKFSLSGFRHDFNLWLVLLSLFN